MLSKQGLLIKFLDQLFQDEVDADHVPLEFAGPIQIPGEPPKFVLFYEGAEFEMTIQEREVADAQVTKTCPRCGGRAIVLRGETFCTTCEEEDEGTS